MQTITLKGYGTNIPPYEAIELGTYDSYGVEQLQIVPSHGWENLSIIASFFPPSGAEPIKVAVLSSGIIDVPPGATAKQSGKGIIVFAGYKANTQLISTNVAYNIRDHKDIASGDPVCPTPSVVDQIVNAAKAAQEGAEKAAQDASEAKANANKAQENAEKAQQAAEKAAEDSAKAGPYAESALDAAKAAKASENAAKVNENAAAISENNARISADKAKASETAAKESAVAAAGSAAQAETQKTAAENAASDAHGYMQTASGAAIAANASAENAAGSKAAAGNSATAAARSEQAAGASEVKAAESEKAAKASEQAAAKSAQAALESKTAAAISEGNAAASAKKAKDIADSLPEDYTTAVNEIAALKTNKADKTELETVKQQVANITPDDSSIGDKPWSSKNIVDTLCPPLEESGNPVVCYPVAGYPLGIKAKWEPVQEGSGTPSPENIRPIKGRDSVTVTRCGENLLNTSQLKPKGYNLAGSNILKPNTTYTFKPVSCGGINFAVILADNIAPNQTTKQFKLTKNYIKEGTSATFTTPSDADSYSVMWLAGYKSGIDQVYPNVQFMLVLGTTAPTAYTPYIGQTTTLTPPETVCGGEVDAVSGDGNENAKIITLDGNKLKFSLYNNVFYNLPSHSAPGISAQANIRCSHFEAKFFSANANYDFCFIKKSYIDSLFASADDLNAYLAAQYAAGTPVQIAYKLAEPVPFTATGAQPIPALSGVNTIYTDVDGVVVTGAEDPKHTITELKNAIISLGGNV